MENVVVQRMVKTGADVPGIYFKVVSAVHSLNLTERDIKLLAFVAVHGNISDKGLRKEFCELTDTTIDAVNNVVSRLKKMGFLVKEKGVIKLSGYFQFDFLKDMHLQLILKHGE